MRGYGGRRAYHGYDHDFGDDQVGSDGDCDGNDERGEDSDGGHHGDVISCV